MPIARPTLALVIGAALLSSPAGAALHGDSRAAAHEARAPNGNGAVMLSEASSRVDPSATRLGDMIPLIRADAAAALAAIDWAPLRLSRRYAISATVVHLTTTRTGDRTLASACTVSAAVRELPSNNLLFIVEGRARAEDSVTDAARAERDALRAAVQGAVAAVPDGLRRSR